MSKLILKSDFRDYYDHWFDIMTSPNDTYATFHRYSRNSMTRRKMFELLESLGNKVPKHDYLHKMKDVEKVVVYTDQFAHRGEGKELLKLKYAKQKHLRMYGAPEMDVNWIKHSIYASEYIGTSNMTMRKLHIGKMCFFLLYESDDSWRSNYGNVKVSVLRFFDNYKNTHAPLWAIDFVHDIAIDYNSAPGLVGTGIEDVLKPEDVVKLIRNWVFDYDQDNDSTD